MSSTSIIACAVLTLSIGYTFAYPSFGDISKLIGEKQKYADSLATVKNIESKKTELVAKFNQIPDSDKKNIDTALPSSLDFVRLISQIDTVAANYGISINKITSKEVSSSVGGSVAEAGAAKPYQSSLIGFSFIASYDKFNAFLGDLEKSLRILDVRYTKIDTQASGIYSYDVEFETYWLKQS